MINPCIGFHRDADHYIEDTPVNVVSKEVLFFIDKRFFPMDLWRKNFDTFRFLDIVLGVRSFVPVFAIVLPLPRTILLSPAKCRSIHQAETHDFRKVCFRSDSGSLGLKAEKIYNFKKLFMMDTALSDQ